MSKDKLNTFLVIAHLAEGKAISKERGFRLGIEKSVQL
jgi:hypothetical protein